ncbi:3-oxoadipate enol-lactonase [Denitratisoma sp. agr-D3]
MPIAQLPGVDLHYEVSSQDAPLPWLTLAHSLAADHTMWDTQVEALAGQFRILRYDLRGHGRSSVPPSPWTFADLVHDVLALWDHLGIARSHFVGLSIGGMIGQYLALDAPQRLDRLVLCSTSSGYGGNREAVAKLWEQRIAQASSAGLDAMVDGTLGRWFTEPYRLEAKEEMARIGGLIAATPVAGYAACGRLVASLDTTDRLPAIATPTLVLVGDEDAGTPPAMAEAIAAAIPGSRLEVLPQASHLLNIEQAELFNALLDAFLAPAS